MTFLLLSAWLGISAGAVPTVQWPAQLLRTVEWKVPDGSHYQEIIYGHKDYGFFRAPALIKNGRVRLELFPPGYARSIEFFLGDRHRPNERIFLGRKKFDSPFEQRGFQPKTKAWGHFSSPFMLATWYFHVDGAFRPAPVMFNALGEMVWTTLDTATPAQKYFPRSWNSLKVKPDQLLIMGDDPAPGFRVVDMKTGDVLRSLPAGKNILHHVFEHRPETEDVVALAYDFRPLSWWQDPAPVFSGLMGLINGLRLPRRTVAASRVIRINLFTGKTNTVWSTFDSFNMRAFPSLSLLSDMDRFVDAEAPEDYLDLLNSSLTQNLTDVAIHGAHADWSHENSVRFYPGEGYLVSQRNLNKVIMVGEDGRLRWTLGSDPGDTYQIRDKAFSMQHDAWLLSGGRVLLFDNNLAFLNSAKDIGPHSRVAIYRLQGDRGTLEKRFVIPGHKSERMGSVSPLVNDNILAYSAGSGEKQPMRFLEFDSDSGKIVGGLVIFGVGRQRSLQGRPFDSIVNEVFDQPQAKAGLEKITLLKPRGPDRAGPLSDDDNPAY